MILTTIEAHLNFTDLLSSLVYLRDFYRKAGLNPQVKYGMLNKAATEVKQLSDFLLIKGSHTVNGLNCTIVEFVKNSETFQ